jgi:hypothetical protein
MWTFNRPTHGRFPATEKETSMRRTLTRMALATAVVTATIGLSGGVASAAPATAAPAAQQGVATSAASQWYLIGSYGRYEWCRQNLQYYWPAFDAQCVYNSYRQTYDLYVWM